MSVRILAAAFAVAALVVAGCGGSSGGGYATGSTAKPADRAATAVKLAKTDLGSVLVDGSGRTLYLFEADKAQTSTCNGACAAAWPPLTTAGKPVAGAGVVASKLSTTQRGDGTTEVMYNGHPLYRYAGDASPGQTNGQESDEYGAEWYVLSPSGNKLEAED